MTAPVFADLEARLLAEWDAGAWEKVFITLAQMRESSPVESLRVVRTITSTIRQGTP